MRFLRTRPLLGSLLLTLWIGWAVWANLPHYADIQATERQVAALSWPSENYVVQPAQAGFPFAYMRYDYPYNGQLSVYDTEPSAALPNLLFCLAGILGVALLVARTRRVSFAGIALMCCLLAPALLLYILFNGPHPDVISYLYLTPLVFLLVSLVAEAVGKQASQNHALNESCQASPAC